VIAVASTTVTLGFALPQVLDATGPAEPVGAIALRAEAAGFAALWTMEVMRPRLLDPLGVLAHAAALTTRVELGVAVLLLPLRAPVLLARELSTIDHLSGGRLIVGLGLGNRNPALYAEHGVATDGRLDRYLGSLQVLKELLETGRTTYEGGDWVVTGETGVPQPVRRPRPPIWLGARTEVAVRRAAREADGLVGAGAGGHQEFLGWLDVLADEFERSGRDRSSFSVAARVYVLVDPTGASRDRLRRWFLAVYGNGDLAERVTLMGDADALAERVDVLRGRGVQHVIFQPVLDFERHIDVIGGLIDS
jgi:alkanesulfonate monooxygenase SsuD/methylene tetrahydromethanopterin reductase-like flavin-dependent oxidoreductase (luciferase family)